MNSTPHRTVPGLSEQDATAATEQIEGRLVALLDLHLTLKHIHWNVVGPNFLSVHEMLDDMVGPVRSMTDTLAERMRTLGGVPRGTPRAIVERRSWDDYDLLTESVYIHLKELDSVFDGIIADHRRAIEATAELDPVTEDVLVAQTAQLEEFQWFVRSFFERAHADAAGDPSSATRAADRRDAHARGGADRSPTADESAAAERAAEKVDVEAASEHFEEMAEVGAAARGEGRV